jgi:hypothetical protein
LTGSFPDGTSNTIGVAEKYAVPGNFNTPTGTDWAYGEWIIEFMALFGCPGKHVTGTNSVFQVRPAPVVLTGSESSRSIPA